MLKKIIVLFLFLNTLSFSLEEDFIKIYSKTLKYEGITYVKNEIEESKFGITKYYSEDIEKLTKDDAYKIAYKKIYKAHNIDLINNLSIKTFIFDWLYHSSPKNAIKRIQKILDIEETGVMNKKTINYINSFSDTELLLFLMKESRLNYLKGLKHYKKYEKGWKLRIANIC